MHRPQPRSTLFPYTTLFRSLQRGDRYALDLGADHDIVSDPSFAQAEDMLVTARPAILDEKRQEGLSPLDRKSTRLNSSHVAISYAVFCLKKKKIDKTLHEYD